VGVGLYANVQARANRRARNNKPKPAIEISGAIVSTTSVSASI
jgi:hypothetical protein